MSTTMDTKPIKLLVTNSGLTGVGILVGSILGLAEGIDDGCVLGPATNNSLNTGILVVLHTAPIAPMPIGVIRDVTLFSLLLFTSASQNVPVNRAVVTLALVEAIALATDTALSVPNELSVHVIK
jgi:hypothetical protein